MRLILPIDILVLSFDYGDIPLFKCCQTSTVENVAVWRNGPTFAPLRVLGDGPVLDELVELNLQSRQMIRVPRYTQILLENSQKIAEIIQPTLIESHRRPADLLKSWTKNMYEIATEVYVVGLSRPVETFLIEINDIEGLAIVGYRPGPEPDGILIGEENCIQQRLSPIL